MACQICYGGATQPMLRRGTIFALTATLGASVASGCRGPEPEVFQVRVTSIDTHGGPALADEQVEGIMRHSLERAPSFSPAERDQRSQRSRGNVEVLNASLEYREIPDAADNGRDLLVRLFIEPPEDLGDELGRDGLDATVMLERKAGEADLESDLQLATDRLAIILQARADLARRSEGAVEGLLATRDAEIILETLAWIRRHPQDAQSRQAADRVAELINDEDENVGLLAIETIGEIGGPEHVAIVIDRIQLTNAGQVSRAYEAIARLGGPDAEGFLRFAARNEDEPNQRAAAERALRRVAEVGGAMDEAGHARTRGHR
ncbi:HEAT repeat domain-containing protein [Pseudenhygromyxa sp. WMMC2535]|uniref:HEAT repeat domain-containing protein n=1 Tax=Pseudenhygromyxa sp. WMMC2535 TaxID=2712867 RepID=UPI0015963CCF|nr:HEAT repeat domain-containing protein [Pseudenhygromyxa sp. WMMC2535]NVB42206.1 HEAT repeat domain-containing protein [Pseudenhygromyxa sp. WMMC2535]